MLYLAQRRLLYLPDTDRPALGTLARLGVRETTLTTADGLSLLAWYLPPPEGAPVIVYFHGNGGHIGYRSERVQRFAEAGFGVLMPEYRGYGGNPGSPSEDGFYADARAALAFLDNSELAPSRRVLYGESLGTGVAVRMATEREVAALILEAPYTSVADVAQYHYPLVPAKLLVRDRFDSLAIIDKVTAPILVLQAEDDPIVPIRFGRALFAAASEPKEAWFAPQGGHEVGRHGGLDVAIAFVQRRFGARVRDHAAE
jgi:fermentation-respiration switch protein FrsA (DUF1100 family)